MLKAIGYAEDHAGMGLWFPCQSQSDAATFLSALADNLASAVEKRFIRNNIWTLASRRLRFALIVVALAPAAVAIMTYAARALGPKGSTGATIFSSIPVALWLAVGIATAMLFALLLGNVIWDSAPTGRTVREATALRERIRFTTAMKLGREMTLSGGSTLTGIVRRTDERSLNERPTTVASLVFDFRNLAERIVATIKGPLIIGIDDLDNLDAEAARRLLGDVRGIFEITNVYFLVSVREEEAWALHLGPLRTWGPDELKSSFYTVLELPPLSPHDTAAMLKPRDIEMSEKYAHLLCLLGAGNWREIVRLAERPPTAARPLLHDEESRLVVGSLEAEAQALLREIVTAYADDSDADAVITGAWRALPADSFSSIDTFTALSVSAIHDFWEPGWADEVWNARVREPWRRFLIRLFVAGSVVATEIATGMARDFNANEIADLRNVLIMSARSSSTAMLMLKSRFGDDLARPYTLAAEMRLIRDTAG